MRFLTVPTRRFSAVLLLAGLSFAIPIEGRASVLWQAASAEDFESLARAAASAREAGRSDEAVALYRRALALQSAWTEGWWYLGTLLYDTDRFREAIPAFEKLVQLAPETPGASNFLGLCAFEVGDYDRALALLEKGRGAAQDDPQLARVSSYHLALLLNRAGRFDTTLEVLSRDLAQGTVSDQITFAFGLAVLHVPLLPGEVDASREAFVHAAGRVGVLSAQGHTLEALDLYPSLLTQNPRVPFLHAAFASALKSAGRTSDAAAQSAEESALFPQALGPRAVAELYANEASRSRFGISPQPSASPHNPPGESFDSVSARAQEALRANHSEQAMALLQQALALRPDWQPGRFQLAALLFSSARYAEALPILKTAVAQNPESGTAWAMLGLCEFETRDFENALLHLQKGAALGFGGSAESVRLARYRLGLLLIHSGRFDQASSVLVPEAEGNPPPDQIRFAIGLALLHRPLFPQDVPAADRALIQSAGEISVLLHASKYDAAFPKLQRLIAAYPSAALLHYVYGVALASLSRYDDALAQFAEESRIEPQSELPHVQSAFVELQTRHVAEALRFARRAVLLAPQSAEAHYVLGRSLLDSGELEEAARELQIAAEKNPGSPEVHFNLAKTYVRLNRREDAERERATFSLLNAELEKQRSQHGSQAYGAAHSASELSQSSPPKE